MSVSFPILQFYLVKPSELTNALNTLIVDFNAALIASGGGAGATGYVTRRQLFEALETGGYLSGLDGVIAGLPVTDPAWIEYKTALTCSQTGPIAGQLASAMGLSQSVIAGVWALAATMQP